MVIYLDYIRENRDITHLSIMDDVGLLYDYTHGEIGDAVELLMLPGHVITFQRPPLYIKREMEIYPIMDDINLNEKWFDIYAKLWKDSEKKAPSLKKIAQATLDRNIKVPRFRKILDKDEYTFGVMHVRLGLFKDLFEYASIHGRLSYFYGLETITVEVETLESA